jgi:hypothetical protein
MNYEPTCPNCGSFSYDHGLYNCNSLYVDGVVVRTSKLCLITAHEREMALIESGESKQDAATNSQPKEKVNAQ